jgi:predicted amidohydrolase YtcJ
MRRFLARVTISACIAMFVLASLSFGRLADDDASKAAYLVLINGKIVTLDAEIANAEAVAIRGSRIVEVGSDEAIRKHVADSTRVVDLAGRLVTPGFIEGHGHFIALGQTKLELDLTTCTTWDEVVSRVAEAAADTKQFGKGRWIVGRGWHQGKWKKPPEPNVEGYPVHAALSKVTPDHPVLLIHATGHMAMVNAKALHLAGIADYPRDPKGGRILRDKEGKPTGALRETAVDAVNRAYGRDLAKRPAKELAAEQREAIRLANAECLRLGVTSFQDAGSSLSEIEALRACVGTEDLTVRLWMMTNDSDAEIAANLLRYRVHRLGDAQFTVGGVKRMIDGALGTHGAWLLEPYDDLPQSTGHNLATVESLRASADLCVKTDWQLCVHAIGDRANREVLDVMADAKKRNAETLSKRGGDLRWRIEHAQHLHPDDIPRFAKLGVIASMQACHATSDGPFVVARLGQRRAKSGAYVWQSLIKRGARVINGTDAPVEPLDPIACFDASVTRRMANGAEFFPEERMTRAQALRSYTLDAAYAAFEEDLKGSLEKGKLADMVVLSKDIMSVEAEKIRSAKVDITILGGKVVYERGK